MARLYTQAALLSALALCACSTVTLRGPVPVDAMRPVIACDFMAADDFQSVDAVGGGACKDYDIGMPLRPGMVLYLSTPTWGPALGPEIVSMSAGPDLPDIEVSLGVGSRQPEVAAPLRLPVRRLGSDGHLTPEETIVLGAVLSLHRKTLLGAPPGGTDVDNTSSNWRKLLSDRAVRGALWNAFVHSAGLRRISAGETRALSIVLSPALFCSTMRAAKRPNGADVLSEDAYALLIGGLFPQDCVTGGSKTIEAFALATDATRAEPLQGVASTRTIATSRPFFQGPWMLFNAATIVSAELDAVSMSGLAGVERRWSLAEWEQSGVCGKDRKIVSVWARGGLSSFHVLRKDETSKPTFKIEEILTVDRASRTIRPVGDPFLRRPSIAEGDLTKLRATDIGAVRWSAPWGGPSTDPCAP